MVFGLIALGGDAVGLGKQGLASIGPEIRLAGIGRENANGHERKARVHPASPIVFVAVHDGANAHVTRDLNKHATLLMQDQAFV